EPPRGRGRLFFPLRTWGGWGRGGRPPGKDGRVVRGGRVKTGGGPATVTGRGSCECHWVRHSAPGKAQEPVARKPGDLSPASQYDPRGRGGSDEQHTPAPAGRHRRVPPGVPSLPPRTRRQRAPRSPPPGHRPRHHP